MSLALVPRASWESGAPCLLLSELPLLLTRSPGWWPTAKDCHLRCLWLSSHVLF